MNVVNTSVFDIFKIGPGPSSSHTLGPMKAAGRFLQSCAELAETFPAPPTAVEVYLYGSLATTGKGHGTDRSIIAGLLGWEPDESSKPRTGRAVVAQRNRPVGFGCHTIESGGGQNSRRDGGGHAGNRPGHVGKIQGNSQGRTGHLLCPLLTVDKDVFKRTGRDRALKLVQYLIEKFCGHG